MSVAPACSTGFATDQGGIRNFRFQGRDPCSPPPLGGLILLLLLLLFWETKRILRHEKKYWWSKKQKVNKYTGNYSIGNNFPLEIMRQKNESCVAKKSLTFYRMPFTPSDRIGFLRFLRRLKSLTLNFLET